jgi:predicted Fe-Mo cluster-binding NifX family protein
MVTKMSKKWSDETKNLVNNSKLNLLRVYDNTYIDQDSVNILKAHNLQEECHCDFCGQAIKYVSVLEFDKQSVISHFQIGRNCMSYLFEYGMKIDGVEHARYAIESAVKKLIAASTQRTRVEKYKKEFSKYLTWLDSLDKSFVAKNGFLTFIYNRLRTGDGVVTMKMMNALDKMIKKFDANNTSNLDEKQSALLKKIDALIEEIKILYDNFESNGTYKFVKSVRDYVENRGNATTKQLDALNNVFKRVKKERVALTQKLLIRKPKKVDNTIPW